MAEGNKALEGVRVLDLTQGIAGPYCTKLLADYGAEVIKVEQPGKGDRTRQEGPFPQDEPDPEKSGLFLHLNSNKKSVTLNIEAKTGREIFKRLASRVDLVVEDLGPDGLEPRGLEYQVLAKHNPGLVLTSLSDFGTSGPYRDYKLTDLIAYALGGYMHTMGDPDKPPLYPGGEYAFYIAGQFAAVGSLQAVLHSMWTGKGQIVSVSILEAAVSSLIYDTIECLYAGAPRRRQGNRRSGVAGSIQPCSDGYVSFNVGPGEQRWQDLFNVVLGQPELADDPRFQTPQSRTAYADDFERLLRDRFKEMTAEEVFQLSQAVRLLVSIIPNTAEVLQLDPHKAREYFVEAEHPVVGTLTYARPLFRMSETPWQLRSPAPLLGQHNAEVYGELLGLGAREITTLVRAGIV